MTNLFASKVAAEKKPFDAAKLADRYRFRATDWTIPEAYLAVLLSAAMADGAFDGLERDSILLAARRSRALATLSPAELAATNDSVIHRLQSRADALREACDTLPREMALSVFAHAVDLILADGDLVKVEAEFLDSLSALLEIERDAATRVLEVLLVKAQY